LKNGESMSKYITEDAITCLNLALELFGQWETFKENYEGLASLGHPENFSNEAVLAMNQTYLAFREQVEPLIPLAAHYGIDAKPLRIICRGHERCDAGHRDDAHRVLTELAAAMHMAKPATHGLPSVVPSKAATRSKVTKDEANIKARRFLKDNPLANVRDLAKGIGCSTGLVSALPAWRAVKEERDKGRQPRKSAVVSLTPKLGQVAGIEDKTLADLIYEQEADAEPSPLQEDPPNNREGAPRKAKIYRK
jgi:hypothetical protein